MIDDNVFVRYLGLPRTIMAVTIPNSDGTFDVYINNILPEEIQRSALAHEMRHIRLGHFYDYNHVYINELEAG